jgi:hypothetical protein
MLDERTEALLIEALSTASGGETVGILRGVAWTQMDTAGISLRVSNSGIGEWRWPSGDLAPDDALLAVQVFDAYLTIASHIQEMPGAVAMNDETRRRIKDVREKIRGMM